jgi:hypothetical protein
MQYRYSCLLFILLNVIGLSFVFGCNTTIESLIIYVFCAKNMHPLQSNSIILSHILHGNYRKWYR